MSIKVTGEDAYFVASNSAKGFFSYYASCFEDPRIQHVFAIKGGPGTGKSRFMRDVADCAVKQGWLAEYIYCSSDPNSLDGVILSCENDCIALLDATAPHVYEPTTPGVREDIVNLGSFWSRSKLAEHATQIAMLNEKKKKAYRMAYRYLAAYGEMRSNRDALIEPYIRTDAMQAYAEKVLEDIKNGKRFSVRTALMHSIGMQGEVTLDTYFAKAKEILLVEDCRGGAQYFMHMLYNELVEKRLQIRVSYDPILPSCIDGLFLCDSCIVLAIGKSEQCPYPHRRISLRRFVDTGGMKAIRPMLNHTEQMCRAMRGGALEAMAQVRKAHFQLEEIYAQSMDFTAKEEFTKAFCESLFSCNPT